MSYRERLAIRRSFAEAIQKSSVEYLGTVGTAWLVLPSPTNAQSANRATQKYVNDLAGLGLTALLFAVFGLI